MNFLKAFFKSILSVFTSGKAEKAFNTVAGIVPVALPIVEAIAGLTPNKSDDEILAAFRRFGVPAIAEIQNTPASQRGYLLLDLATKILAGKYPGVATNILNSAVQIAVTAMKAK